MNFKAFLKQNAKQAENKKVFVSDRFVGEDGKPLLWEVRQLSAGETEELTTACTTIKKGKPETDSVKLLFEITARSVVYPDLLDTELQDSYGAMGASDLLKKMLTAKEFAALSKVIDETFNQEDGDLVEISKN